MPNAQDILNGVKQFASDYADELQDIATVEGAGAIARGLANNTPYGLAANAFGSGYMSYLNELNRLSNNKDMSNLEKLGRAGLIGLSDAAWGAIPYGTYIKPGIRNALKYGSNLTDEMLRYGKIGLANLGINLANNRVVEDLNDNIWSDY